MPITKERNKIPLVLYQKENSKPNKKENKTISSEKRNKISKDSTKGRTKKIAENNSQKRNYFSAITTSKESREREPWSEKIIGYNKANNNNNYNIVIENNNNSKKKLNPYHYNIDNKELKENEPKFKKIKIENKNNSNRDNIYRLKNNFGNININTENDLINSKELSNIFFNFLNFFMASNLLV